MPLYKLQTENDVSQIKPASFSNERELQKMFEANLPQLLGVQFITSEFTTGDPRKTKEIEIQVIARLRRHPNHPKFIALGKRLEDIKNRLEPGLLLSVEYLKILLEIAKEVVQAEKEVDPVEEHKVLLLPLPNYFMKLAMMLLPR